MNALDKTGLAIGWSPRAVEQLRKQVKVIKPDGTLEPAPNAFFRFVLGFLLVSVGYVLTALATTLGAPFWFDVLNRLMVIRATVKPHEKSREERSQDPQDPQQVTKVALIPPAPVPPPADVSPAADDDQVFASDLSPDDRPREDGQHRAPAQPLVVIG